MDISNKTDKKKEDLRVTRTKLMLRNALLELMRDEGYKKITVEMLARKALVSRNTFYLHYLDKKDLLTQIEDEEIERIRVEIDRVPLSMLGEEGLANSLTLEGLLNVFAHIRENGDFFELIVSDRGDQAFMPRLTEAIAHALRDKLGRDGLRSRYIIPAIAAAYASLFSSWIETGMHDDPKVVAEAFLGAFREVPMRMIGTPTKNAPTIRSGRWGEAGEAPRGATMG